MIRLTINGRELQLRDFLVEWQASTFCAARIDFNGDFSESMVLPPFQEVRYTKDEPQQGPATAPEKPRKVTVTVTVDG